MPQKKEPMTDAKSKPKFQRLEALYSPCDGGTKPIIVEIYDCSSLETKEEWVQFINETKPIRAEWCGFSRVGMNEEMRMYLLTENRKCLLKQPGAFTNPKPKGKLFVMPRHFIF
jgi:hypothetical protein